MSLGRGAQNHGVAVAPAARIRSAGFATRLNRALLSGLRWPLLLVELGVILIAYEAGVRFIPGVTLDGILSPYIGQALAYAVICSSVALGLGSYDRDRRFRLQGVVMIAITASALATLLILASLSFSTDSAEARTSLAYGAASALGSVLVVRGFLIWVVSRQPYRFTVLGQSSALNEAMEELGRAGQGSAHQLVPWASLVPEGAAPTGDRLVAAGIAEIVVAPQSISDEDAVNVALLGFQSNIPVVHDRVFYARLLERVPIDVTSKRWILEQGIARPQAVVLVLKRMSDVVMSITGLLLLSPLFLAIAVAIRFTSAGPVFYVQTRQGRYFRAFQMIKFRTMRHTAEVQADASFARVGDARVTSVGKVLRRAHLDELPQLLNILRGEMSMVGPRPETVEFARRMDEQIPLYELRYLVRPGLTGHAQLKQGYASDTVIDTQTKLSYDLYYLCNYSLRLDLRLLLRTVFFLVRGSR